MIYCKNAILRHTSRVTDLKLLIGSRRNKDMDKRINTGNLENDNVQVNRKKTMEVVLAVFVLCNIVKYIEFLIIKTDQTIISENIICKLFMIAVLFVALSKLKWNWNKIGFSKKYLMRNAVLGLFLGISTFFVSYLTEYLILVFMGKTPHIQFFITNFALSNQNIGGTSFAAVAVCIIGNIVNVWAEEGMFRGLFFQMMKTSFTEKQSNLIQSLLFGLWHIVTVIVWLLDGSINLSTACFMAFGYIVLSGVLAYEWGLCIAFTGTIWAGAFEHFFNNFITNSLHMVTDTGIDKMQIFRIVLSNVLSLTFVIMISKSAKRRKLHKK